MVTNAELSLGRWISPCEDWRPLQWEVSCDPQGGLGTLLHCVAGLGHPVSLFFASDFFWFVFSFMHRFAKFHEKI